MLWANDGFSVMVHVNNQIFRKNLILRFIHQPSI